LKMGRFMDRTWGWVWLRVSHSHSWRRNCISSRLCRRKRMFTLRGTPKRKTRKIWSTFPICKGHYWRLMKGVEKSLGNCRKIWESTSIWELDLSEASADQEKILSNLARFTPQNPLKYAQTQSRQKKRSPSLN
jgi:hypothetical protein